MFPKILHLTCKNKRNIGNPVWVYCYNKFRTMYSGYEIILYDNNDIYQIVSQHFPEHLQIIRSVSNGGAIADTFRYLILYLKGGIYADMDCEPLRHIDELFTDYIYYHGNNKNHNFSLVLSQANYYNTYNLQPCSQCEQISATGFNCKGHNLIDPETTQVIISNEFSKFFGNHGKQAGQCCQWFIIAQPGVGLFKSCYTQCIRNIESKKYLISIHNYTGPMMFSMMVREYMNKTELKITMLPPDVFCVGPHIPHTQNSFIRHHFTGSWHKEENSRKMKPLALVS